MTTPPAKSGPNIVGIVAGVGGAILGALAVQYFMGSGKSDREKIDETMSKNRIGQIIKRDFPQDYETVLNQIVVLAQDKSLTDRDREMKAVELTAGVRVKYSSFAAKASDNALREVLRNQIAVYKAAKEKIGDTGCIDLVNNGPAALVASGQMSKLSEQADNAGYAVMSAIAEGRRQPNTYREPTDADFTAFDNAVLAKGLTEEQYMSASDGINNPGDCDGVTAIFEAAESLPGESGSVLRSFLVGSVVGS